MVAGVAVPLRLGRPSRFRAAEVLPGIFYASEDIETAVSEAAHWRLVAFSRSPGFQRPRTSTPMSAFAVMVDAKAALDLTMGDLAKDADSWTNPNDYTATQQLAIDARMIGVEAIRAPSARRQNGINVAVLEPAALVPPPLPHSSWAFLAAEDGLIATRGMGGAAMRFTSSFPCLFTVLNPIVPFPATITSYFSNSKLLTENEFAPSETFG